MTDRCPICNSPTELFAPIVGGDDAYGIKCTRCGEYMMSGTLFASFRPLDKRQIPVVSNYIRHNQRIELDTSNFEQLKRLPQIPVSEKAINFLKYLAEIEPIPGHHILCEISSLSSILDSIKQKLEYDQEMLIRSRQFLPIFAESLASDINEFIFITEEFLQNRHQYIKYKSNQFIIITPDGWAFLEELKYKPSESNMGFIAMWFDPIMDNLFTNIESAIRNSGYKPKRVDKHEHINKIDDEIIALIRESKFIVADYTGQRGGVYFESGFAMGLNKPVFWICKETELKEVHFDTNHFNYLTWTEDHLPEFATALQNRIEAVIGRGPIIKAE